MRRIGITEYPKTRSTFRVVEEREKLGRPDELLASGIGGTEAGVENTLDSRDMESQNLLRNFNVS